MKQMQEKTEFMDYGVAMAYIRVNADEIYKDYFRTGFKMSLEYNLHKGKWILKISGETRK